MHNYITSSVYTKNQLLNIQTHTIFHRCIVLFQKYSLAFSAWLSLPPPSALPLPLQKVINVKNLEHILSYSSSCSNKHIYVQVGEGLELSFYTIPIENYDILFYILPFTDSITKYIFMNKTYSTNAFFLMAINIPVQRSLSLVILIISISFHSIFLPVMNHVTIHHFVHVFIILFLKFSEVIPL